MAPTRALIVEDVESWTYTLSRAARRAGASEVRTCADVASVADTLREVRFDIAIIDISLDPDDNTDSGGAKVLEMIRDVDGPSTRCVLVTGWQGDRMEMQASLAQKHGVEGAFMKERYDAPTVIAKLTELLEGASERRIAKPTPMAHLTASADAMRFQHHLLESFSPKLAGDMRVLFSLVDDLTKTAVPLVAEDPEKPMDASGDGGSVGMYWSRGLGTAIAVELTTSAAHDEDHDAPKAALVERFHLPSPPELLAEKTRKNLRGRLWELPGIIRAVFP